MIYLKRVNWILILLVFVLPFVFSDLNIGDNNKLGVVFLDIPRTDIAYLGENQNWTGNNTYSGTTWFFGNVYFWNLTYVNQTDLNVSGNINTSGICLNSVCFNETNISLWKSEDGITMLNIPEDLNIQEKDIFNVSNLFLSTNGTALNEFKSSRFRFINGNNESYLKIGDETFLDSNVSIIMGNNEPDLEVGEIVFLLYAQENKTIMWGQFGKNNSAGGLGNSWMVIPNSLINDPFFNNNMSKISNCLLVDDYYNVTPRLLCDTSGYGASLKVQGGGHFYREVFIGGRDGYSSGIRSEGTAQFVMQGNDFNIINGSNHIQTPITCEFGFDKGDNINKINTNFEGSISPFVNNQSDLGDWVSIADGSCDDGDCAKATGVGNGYVAMVADFDTTDINQSNLSFVYSLVSLLGAGEFSVIISNSTDSEILYTDTTTNIDKSSQILPISDTWQNRSELNLTFLCDISSSNKPSRQCFVDTVKFNGSAMTSTLSNQSGFNSEICFSDGTRGADGNCTRGFFYSFCEDKIFSNGIFNFTGESTSGISGSGTTNNIPKWSGTTSLTNANIVDDGILVTVTSSLNVTNNLNASFLFGNGTNIDSINHSKLDNGTMPSACPVGFAVTEIDPGITTCTAFVQNDTAATFSNLNMTGWINFTDGFGVDFNGSGNIKKDTSVLFIEANKSNIGVEVVAANVFGGSFVYPVLNFKDEFGSNFGAISGNLIVRDYTAALDSAIYALDRNYDVDAVGGWINFISATDNFRIAGLTGAETIEIDSASSKLTLESTSEVEINAGTSLDINGGTIDILSGNGNANPINIITGDGASCFTEGTLITLDNGLTKAIEKIKVNDTVLSYDTVNDVQVSSKVLQVFKKSSNHIFILNNKIKTTKEHPFWTRRGWIKVKDLVLGDDFLDINNNWIRLQTKVKVIKDVTVYNFHVDNTNTYYANNVLVHNKGSPSSNITISTGAGGVIGSTKSGSAFIKTGVSSGGISGDIFLQPGLGSILDGITIVGSGNHNSPDKISSNRNNFFVTGQIEVDGKAYFDSDVNINVSDAQALIVSSPTQNVLTVDTSNEYVGINIEPEEALDVNGNALFRNKLTVLQVSNFSEGFDTLYARYEDIINISNGDDTVNITSSGTTVLTSGDFTSGEDIRIGASGNYYSDGGNPGSDAVYSFDTATCLATFEDGLLISCV